MTNAILKVQNRERQRMTKANAKSRKAVLGRMPVLALLASLMTSIAYADAAYTVVTNDQGEVTVRATTPSGAEVDLAFRDPDVKSVTYERNEGGAILLTGTEPSTYTGGTTVNVNQLRFRNPCAFGTGPVVLNCDGGAFLNFDWKEGVDLTNKVVYSAQEWAMGLGDYNLTLHALGSTLSPALGYLGRASGSKCLISLALDSTENDPLDGIVLRGAQTMNIDGGIFKAKASAQPDYFTLNNPSTDSIKTKVSDKGFAIDVAEGGSTRFGIPLAIDNPPVVTTNMTVWGEPSNNSFEDGSTGWTLNKGEITSSPAIVANSNTSWIFADTDNVSFDRFRTKFGTNQLAIRGGNNVVSHSFSVSKSGEAYVTFWMTSRPSKSGSDYNSDHLAVDVTLTPEGSGAAQTITLPGRPQNLSQTYGYLQYCIGPFSVVPGDYRITLKVEKGDATSKALFFDLVQLCKLDVTTNLTTVAKTGAGVVTFDDLNFSRGLLAVRGGELRFGDSRLTDMSAEVSAGATFAVGAAATFDNAVVKVPADATLRFVGPIETNLIRNPSFEEDAITTASGYDYIKPTGWDPKVVESNPQNSYQPYFCQVNGSTLSETSPWTSAGTQTVALREKVCLKQTFTAARAGAYRIAFTYACRDWPSTNLRLHASIDHDGDKIALTEDGGLVPSSKAFSSFSAVVELAAGNHELRFDADGDDTEAKGRGMVVLIDDVLVAESRSVDADFAGARFELKSGSTLRLDNPERVTVDEFYVDGVRLSGGKSAIRKAGVTVVGNGSIHVGDAVGMTILLR